jgi:hypothetical protein
VSAKYGATISILANGNVDDNSCSDICTEGCSLDSLPSACAAKWGPTGRQKLQDPDKNFHIITIQAKQVTTGFVKLSVFVDGNHMSPQPPCHLTNANASTSYSASDPGIVVPSLDKMRLGGMSFGDASHPLFMNGDVAELMIYNAALTVPELDRVANYLSRKFALNDLRLDEGFASPTRSVPLSCTNCAGPGPVGEAGTTYDSHLVLAAAIYTGPVTVVTSATVFTINPGAAAAGLVGKLVTVCIGLCSIALPQARGTAVITAASGTDSAVVVTVSGIGIAGMAITDGFYISASDYCAEDWGAVTAVTSTTVVTLAATQVVGNNAMAGALLAVCVGLCKRASDPSSRISNLRGSAIVSSNTGPVAALATPISGLSVGDAFVLYNVHKTKLQLTSNATGLAGAGTDNLYSYAGFYIYFKNSGRCGGRGTRIISYTASTKCATLGAANEVGDYMIDSTNLVEASDLAIDGACRGTNCQPPDVGGIGGSASGHVSSIKIISTNLLTSCTVGTMLSAEGSSIFTATAATVASGGITSIAITNHGAGYKAGTFSMRHGNIIGNVITSSNFVLLTGSGGLTVANALAGITIVVCAGPCPSAVASTNLTSSLRGSSAIATSTLGDTPVVSLSTGISGVVPGDEYVFWGGPIVYSNAAACLCNSLPFNSAALAYNSIPCLRAIVADWSDALDGCPAGGAQEYLLVKDADYKAVATSDYLAGCCTAVSSGTDKSGPATGGSSFAVRGAYLYPNDVHFSSGPSLTNVQLLSSAEAALNEQYVLVTFGRRSSTISSSEKCYRCPCPLRPTLSHRDASLLPAQE